MLAGNIVDVYPDYKNNLMITWLLHKGHATRVETPYEPSFYIHADTTALYKLAAVLQELPQVKQLTITRKKIMLGSDTQQLVLEVIPKTLNSLHNLATMVDSWGKFYQYQLFNVDLRLPTRYLHSNGVFCNASVAWTGSRFVLHDTQWALDYELPLFSICHFDVNRKTTNKLGSFNDPIASIVLDDYEIEEENEADTILAAVRHVQQVDPDIMYTVRGDNVVFPFLYHRARLCGIDQQVNLGRDPQVKQQLRPVKQSKSYFSYGRIIFRPAFYTLLGRIHIDRVHSFLYGESGLRGLVDISRCSNIPLQQLSRLGPGTAISQIQVNKALDQGYLIPWKKNMPEMWKTGLELLEADRGGLMLEPYVGLHEDVIELDYASLYPNVMLRYNLSPETMLCSCCKDSLLRVPQLGYHICVRRTGLLPQVLKPILHRRFCFKARSKNKQFDREVYKELQMAWKWVLLVCFGYTGYRNARYGRIECHESITAFSRDILLTAVELAEQAGYTVLHGIIDSLWVKQTKDDSIRPSRLTKMISDQTGIRMDVEGRYHWIVFLPNKQVDVGALTRYYGLFDTGELKIRGVELRQHNTPLFLQQLQQDILQVFTRAHNAQEFHEVLPDAVQVVFAYSKRLVHGEVDPEDLVYTTRISKGVAAYKVNNLVKCALLQLRNAGIHVEPGQSVRYLVTDEHAHDHTQRVCANELRTGQETIDVGFYLRQIAKCGESLLLPFGYPIEKLLHIANQA